MGEKPKLVKEDITLPIAKNNIDTVNKTEKSRAKKIKKSSSNKSHKSKSLDKSKSNLRTELEDIVKSVNMSGSISSASLTEKSTKIEKPK